MTEYPAPVADIMDAESVRAELAEVEARARKLRAALAAYRRHKNGEVK